MQTTATSPNTISTTALLRAVVTGASRTSTAALIKRPFLPHGTEGSRSRRRSRTRKHSSGRRRAGQLVQLQGQQTLSASNTSIWFVPKAGAARSVGVGVELQPVNCVEAWRCGAWLRTWGGERRPWSNSHWNPKRCRPAACGGQRRVVQRAKNARPPDMHPLCLLPTTVRAPTPAQHPRNYGSVICLKPRQTASKTAAFRRKV